MADVLRGRLDRQVLISQRGNRFVTQEFLEHLSTDIVPIGGYPGNDDFIGDTLHGGYATTADAGATAAAVVAGTVNGEISLITGATNDERSYLTGASLQFNADRNACMIVRLKVSAITTVKIEVGLTDALTETAPAGIVLVMGNASTAPTMTASNAVAWVFDTDGIADQWKAVGVQADTVATALVPGTAQATLVADTYVMLGIQLIENTARFYHWTAAGVLTYASPVMASAVTNTTLLVPWVFVQTRDAASRTLTVDFVKYYQRRYN